MGVRFQLTDLTVTTTEDATYTYDLDSPIVVVVGQTGTGKSTMLELIKYTLEQLVRPQLRDLAWVCRGGFRVFGLGFRVGFRARWKAAGQMLLCSKGLLCISKTLRGA